MSWGGCASMGLRASSISKLLPMVALCSTYGRNRVGTAARVLGHRRFTSLYFAARSTAIRGYSSESERSGSIPSLASTRTPNCQSPPHRLIHGWRGQAGARRRRDVERVFQYSGHPDETRPKPVKPATMPSAKPRMVTKPPTLHPLHPFRPTPSRLPRVLKFKPDPPWLTHHAVI